MFDGDSRIWQINVFGPPNYTANGTRYLNPIFVLLAAELVIGALLVVTLVLDRRIGERARSWITRTRPILLLAEHPLRREDPRSTCGCSDSRLGDGTMMRAA